MLKSIDIRFSRSCQKTKFDINSNISALIGKNGAGKTNILKAIGRIGTIVRNEPEDGMDLIEPFNISIAFSIEKRTYQYNIIKQMDEKNLFKYNVLDSLIDADTKKVIFKKNLAKVHFDNKKNDISPETPAIFLLYNLHSKNEIILNVYKYLTSIKYYHTHDIQIKNAVFLYKDKYEQWRANPLQELENKILYKLYDLQLSHNESFEEVLSLLKDLNLVTNIVFDDFSNRENISDNIKNYIFLNFVVNNEYRRVDQLSEGTKQIISFLLNLFYDKSSLMLIEEPESSIHFGLMKKIVDIFRSYSDEHQIIFSTHSSQVLDKLKPDELIFVRMENGKTIAKNPTLKQIKEINNFLNETGPLGDYIAATGGEG